MENHSVKFFDNQFQTQVNNSNFSLNPFEQLALPFLKGNVLDLGCGLGNLSIGLLMFMEKSKAYEMLNDIKEHVLVGGYAVINVLIDSTTYLDMFDLKHYYLFGHSELQEQFIGWEIVESKYDNFDAPNSTIKAFITLIARKQ